MKHIILYSGGLVSWRVADLVIQEHGEQNVVLLFTDTCIEDEDLYRFLWETWQAFGCEMVSLCDGRTPWQVFRDVRAIGNTRMDPCSRVLKREPTRRWLDANASPEEDIIYLGFDMFEDHRFQRAIPHWQPWTIRAPMVDVYETRPMLMALCAERGIKPPRMYREGFSHNNCGGFCVKAGQGHFAHLLATRPDTYRMHEEEEEEMRQYLGKDVAILRDFTGGEVTPLTLRELRRRIESDQQVDMFDVRGCGCFAGV